MLTRIPSLENAFEEKTSWQAGFDTGSVVVFETVFMPYIIYSNENDLKEDIDKCSDFIKECIYSNDSYQKVLLNISIIDNFHLYDIEDKLSQYLHPKSCEVFTN